MIPKLIAAAALVLVSEASAQPQVAPPAMASKPKPDAQFERLSRAAEQGNAAAQHELGVRYSLGQGVPQDYGAALHWYRRAASQGYAASQYYLGAMLQYGVGVAKDPAGARRWYRYAALQGHSGAQANLGELLASQAQHEEALRWLRLAVAQGDAHALFLLGLAYRDGRGVPVDQVEAHKWLSLAAARTSDDQERVEARRVLQQLSQTMTPQQQRQAQELAKQWRPLAEQQFLAVP